MPDLVNCSGWSILCVDCLTGFLAGSRRIRNPEICRHAIHDRRIMRLAFSIEAGRAVDLLASVDRPI